MLHPYDGHEPFESDMHMRVAPPLSDGRPIVEVHFKLIKPLSMLLQRRSQLEQKRRLVLQNDLEREETMQILRSVGGVDATGPPSRETSLGFSGLGFLGGFGNFM
jgi:hypothetical protein